MRGGDARTEGLFCYVSCEQRVPQDHPLRRVLPIVDAALADLSGEFAALCAPIGRPSIPPEKLLRALLLQAFDSVRSGASADRAAELQPAVPLVHRPRDRRSGVGRHGVHQEPRAAARRRDRGQVLPGGAQPAAGRGAVVGRALHGRWHADRGVRHLKTFRPKADPGAEPPAGGGRHAERDFHGERRSNATHASTTDPEARLLRKRGAPGRPPMSPLGASRVARKRSSASWATC